jgi:hypothetical protein
MAVPWLRLLDTALGLADIARTTRRRTQAQARGESLDELAATTPFTGAIEARLTGIVVAALKEAFNRDHERMELEREQIAAERQRAERALRLELIRRAGEREIGRLRLLSGVAAASWLGTLFFSTRLLDAALSARVALALGWLFLLAALGAAFTAQSRIGRDLDATTEGTPQWPLPSSGALGAAAPWLLVAGLAIIGLGVVTL